MVALVLFAALAFFAVGQAGAARNGAQSAADAAALAAAQESRDLLGEDLWAPPVDVDFLRRLLTGEASGESGAACAVAARLAGENEATVLSCGRLADGRWGFTVRVRAVNPVGDTVLPGTENDHAEATATAVVEPQCDFDPAPTPEAPASSDGPDGSDDPEPPDPAESSAPPGEDDDAPSLGELRCDGGSFELDPDEPDGLPEISDLLAVRLAED